MDTYKEKRIEGEKLLQDYYSRQKENKGYFFGVDTSIENKLEDVTEDPAWRKALDVDYYISYHQAGDSTEHRITHEVKTSDRTLAEESRYSYNMPLRGIIPIEFIQNGKWLYKDEWETMKVPGTNKTVENLCGAGWAFKGAEEQAKWFHFYFPLMEKNEGRVIANEEEKARMKKTAPGTKMIIEAPAGLYISMTHNVFAQLVMIAQEYLGEVLPGPEEISKRPLTERRKVLEEYSSTGGLNFRVPVIKLLEARDRAENMDTKHRGNVNLIVRPVLKYYRNNGRDKEEVEIAERSNEYVMPKRLKQVYFNSDGQLKKTIPGYWDDASQYGRLLGYEFAEIIRQLQEL